MTAPPQDYARFVNRLADELVAKGAITSAAVERAFRKVPRHLFIDRAKVYIQETQEEREIVCDHERPDPEILDRIYQDHVITLSPTSTSSQPECMAWMLEDLRLEPGMKVFEVGTASGYNAALIAELVGDPALVYSLEIDEKLANSARRHIEEAGYRGVTVVAGDGAEGYAAGGPYDAIVVTCGCTDLAPAWVEQLSEEGVILCPIHMVPAGDPTLLVRRTSGILEGHFTRFMYFVQCRSSLLPSSAEAETIDVADALGLGPKQQSEPQFPQRRHFRGRSTTCSFFLFLSLHMRPGEFLVAADGFAPCGIADPSLRQACVLSADDGRALQAIGGTRLLERFQQLAARWESLGAPDLTDYVITVFPRGRTTHTPGKIGAIRRKHYEYVVSAPSAPAS